MNWELLILLACPLMMLFCMKGMMGGNKEKDAKAKADQPQVSPSEMQSLQIKMAEMMEQNHKLMQEMQSMKESQSMKDGQPVKEASSNVVELKEEPKEAKAKKVVS
jgi:uncharacterized protein (DUF3084 family)